MKKNLIIGILLAMVMQLSAQSITDQKIILEKVITHVTFDKYAHTNSFGDLELVLLDNGIAPSNLALSCFGNPVVFIKDKDLQDRNIQAYLKFNTIDYSSDTIVMINFEYRVVGEVKIHEKLRFEKLVTGWELKETISLKIQ